MSSHSLNMDHMNIWKWSASHLYHSMPSKWPGVITYTYANILYTTSHIINLLSSPLKITHVEECCHCHRSQKSSYMILITQLSNEAGVPCWRSYTWSWLLGSDVPRCSQSCTQKNGITTGNRDHGNIIMPHLTPASDSITQHQHDYLDEAWNNT